MEKESFWSGFWDSPRQIAKKNEARLNEGASKIVCPHCQTAGHVTIRQAVRKKGISGGKATGAIATGGASMFLTGLSRKEGARHLMCGNCKMEWDVA